MDELDRMVSGDDFGGGAEVEKLGSFSAESRLWDLGGEG